MLKRLQVRDFRCFEALSVEFAPSFNFITGANGEGKTSLLEAACVLLRLQSQRSSSLAPVIRVGAKWFGVRGTVGAHELDFRYSRLRRSVKFDDVEQRTNDEYLHVARVVSLANTDIELVRGGSDARRRYVDFIGVQIIAPYRQTLRAYERALRSRNALLKQATLNARALAAYDAPLIEHGTQLREMRSRIVERIAPIATREYQRISGDAETLDVNFIGGFESDFANELAASRTQEMRLRQTLIGPHRDDIELHVAKMPASSFGSEGQQRTVALALKLAQARLFSDEHDAAPIMLIDDIFGELDRARRNALLDALPGDAQKLVTATNLDWRERFPEGVHYQLDGHEIASA